MSILRVISLLLLFALIIIPFLYPSMHYDEATYSLGGSLINKGYVYGKNFMDNKLPAIYILSSFITKISLGNYFFYRSITILLYLFSAYLFYKLCVGYGVKFPIEFIFFLFIFLLFGFGIYPFLLTETFSLPLFLIFLISLNEFFKGDESLFNSLSLGLSAGFSVLFRHNFFIFFMIFYFIFFVLFKKTKFVLISLFFFLLPLLLMFLYFYPYLPVFLKFNQDYVRSTIMLNEVVFSLEYRDISALPLFFLMLPLSLFFVFIYYLYKSFKDCEKFDFLFYSISLIFLVGNALLIVYSSLRFFIFSFIPFLLIILKRSSFMKAIDTNNFYQLVIMYILIFFFLSNFLLSFYTYFEISKVYQCSFVFKELVKSYSCKDWVSENPLIFYSLSSGREPAYYLTYYGNSAVESHSLKTFSNYLSRGICLFFPLKDKSTLFISKLVDLNPSVSVYNLKTRKCGKAVLLIPK